MSDGVPQFDTADYGAGAQVTCAGCRRPLDGSVYRVSGQTVCEACTEALRQQQPPDSHAAFVRALLFGTGAALLGLALYAAVAIATHLVIGFVSLAVGFLVGKAMLHGSGGARGRRYQLLAVALTYLSVSLSMIPIALYHLHEQGVSIDPARALGRLALMGVASPFLDLRDPVHGLIGLVILFVGLRIAWRLLQARPLRVEGPLALSPAPAVAGDSP